MPPRPVTPGTSLLSLALVVLVVAGCGGEEPSTPAAAPATSTASVSPIPSPPPTVEGVEDEAPPPDAGFPASIADDSGDERSGVSADPTDEMMVTGVRLQPQNGYDRVVVDLNTNSIPFWTARYTEASTAAGDPVAVAGESYLRLGLFTENSSAEPVAAVLGESGVVAEIRPTGSLAGYQEVLIGVRGAPAPFRTFGLTDPGRIVIDIRPAG